MKKIEIKKFDELSNKELYEILKLRNEVFIVEQSSAYNDVDGNDYWSLHVFIYENSEIVAYLRFLEKNKNTVQIGRVISKYRKRGLGEEVLENAIKYIREKLNYRIIYLEAQTYAIDFYKKFGFRIISEEFLEDDIAHVKMILNIGD